MLLRAIVAAALVSIRRSLTSFSPLLIRVEAGLNTDRPMGLCLSGVTKGSVEMRVFEASMMLRDALGADLVDPYVELHLAEWKDYMRRPTGWGRNYTLDV
jgi:glutamine synthetase